MASELSAQVLCIVLHDAQAKDPLAEWVATDAVRLGLRDDVGEVVMAVLPETPASGQGVVQADATSSASLSATHRTTMEAVDKALAAHQAERCGAVAGGPAQQVRPPLLCLIVVVFWDGHAEASKSTLAQLKQVCDKKWQTTHAPQWGERVEVLVQALNAKCGDASIMNNRTALIASLRKRLQTSGMAAKGWWRERAVRQPDSCHVDPHSAPPPPPPQQQQPSSSSSSVARSGAGGSASSTAAPILGETDVSVTAVRHAVESGQGETFFLLSDGDRAGLASKVAALKLSCDAAEVGCAPVMQEPREVHVPHGAATGANKTPAASAVAAPTAGTAAAAAAVPAATTALVAQEFHLRRRCPPAMHLELRLAMCGNVDSGKSTLTSVLTRGCRDDGRGLARAFVFNHKHEAATGRTSSISENHLGFSAEGGVVNYALLRPHRPDAEVRPLAPAEVALQLTAATVASTTLSGGGDDGGGAARVVRQYTAQELASHSSKVTTLYDLAGHERYLKTTVLGMTRNMPDYACIVVSANNGIQRMTKEHLALCLALKLPFFVVVTRIDATPPNVCEETLSSIHKLLKIPTVRKLPYPVRRHDEVVLAAKNLRHDRIAPIFEVSNVTGVGIPDVLQFINLLPIRRDWRQARAMPREMIIDSTFFVTGVGTVVGGIITQGVFHVGDTVLLGPDGFGLFRPVSIKSIHIKGVDSSAAAAGSDAALCLKKEKRSAIRKGNILADVAHPPRSYWQFEAEITILYHSTTITANYEPVIHSTTVRQSARITYVAQEVLRTGDKSLARFHLLYRPEYMKEGQRLIFREGRTKGIGIVTKLICDPDDQVLAKNKLRKKAQEKLHAPVAVK
ncbi:GTP-binding elongation factor tu family protein [Novymonas esmeraldas]|uniref:GTP-binding elongation factor tu family protein n=1 Tax=Novymonas esmeraldas TaxID=1808958 RepID=A0AAW0FBP2_9TRYP